MNKKGKKMIFMLQSLQVDLSLRLKTKTGYTELCQIIGESYCHYNDLCSILKDFMTGKKCPEDIRKKFNNTCACPFNKVRDCYFLLYKFYDMLKANYISTYLISLLCVNTFLKTKIWKKLTHFFKKGIILAIYLSL
jgi:hypothetical protein